MALLWVILVSGGLTKLPGGALQTQNIAMGTQTPSDLKAGVGDHHHRVTFCALHSSGSTSSTSVRGCLM